MGDKEYIQQSILIVDDNIANLQILANIFSTENYRIAMAKDGGSALDFITREKPDLILLDIMMPVIDGFEVCRRLKSRKNTKEIPIIFISALTDTESKIKGFDAGGVDYITKPFQNKEVLARISAHLNIQRLRKSIQKKNILLQQEVEERKQIEKELRTAKKALESANKYLEKRVQDELEKRLKQHQLLIQKSKLESLGKMAAGIAHEINQPLTGISMGLENILFKLSSDKITDEYLIKKINYFQEDINRINHIINHIRTFSRDQTSVLFENIDVNEVCKNALLMMETQYKNHNIKIILDLDNSIGFTVGNKYKLEQVVLNILSNAKDAVDEKYNSVRNSFYQKEIKIKTYQNKESIFLEIEDNGTGIPEEETNNIFDPFFTTKSHEQGTGLGLSISYGIIKEMKGEISVNSELNEYTVMKISLPAVNKREKP